MTNEDCFYVYEHWRPDTDACFYVGKGKGNRAWRFSKHKSNKHYTSILKKLAALGMCVEVRMVANGMSDSSALALEISRIAFWRSAGVRLANLTDGGDGAAGYRHTIEARVRIGAKNKERVPSPETLTKMSKSMKEVFSDLDRRAKRTGALIKALRLPETRTKKSEAGKKRVHSPESCAKISRAAKLRSAIKRQQRELTDQG